MRHHRHAAVDLSMRFPVKFPVSMIYVPISITCVSLSLYIYIYIDIYIYVYLYMCKDLVIKW